MRTYEEYHKILSLWDTGLYTKSEVNRKVRIPRATIHDCTQKFGSITGLEAEKMRNLEIAGESGVPHLLKAPYDLENVHEAYDFAGGGNL